MNASSLNKTSEQRANEPSMEEILASIRRIIADDRMLPLTQRATPAPQTESRGSVDDEVADRAAPQERPSPPPEQRRADPLADRNPGPDLRSLRVLPGGQPQSEPARPSPAAPVQSEDVLSEAEADDFAEFEAAEAHEPPSHAALEEAREDCALESGAELAAEPLISATTDASVASSFQSLATTVFLQNTGLVEQSLRDLLRPLLKRWLDENLPSIVERLVRTEIERVARGGRG